MNTCYTDAVGLLYVATAYGDEAHFAAVKISEQPFTMQCLDICPIRDTQEDAQADLENYAAFHGLKENYGGTISFDNTAGHDVCPICGNEELVFSDGKFEGCYYFSNWHCTECGTYGKQVEKMEYDGHVIDVRNLGFLPENPERDSAASNEDQGHTEPSLTEFFDIIDGLLHASLP